MAKFKVSLEIKEWNKIFDEIQYTHPKILKIFEN